MSSVTFDMPQPTHKSVMSATTTPAFGPTIMTGKPTNDGRIALTMDARGWIALVALLAVFVGGLVSLHGRLSSIETTLEHVQKQGDRHERQLESARPIRPFGPQS